MHMVSCMLMCLVSLCHSMCSAAGTLCAFEIMTGNLRAVNGISLGAKEMYLIAVTLYVPQLILLRCD